MGSYRKGLLLSLGSIIQVQVDLQAVLPTKRSGLKRLCPEHHQPVRQNYECPEGHPVTEYVSGKETVEGWKVVRPEEKPVSLATDALELIPVPAAELEANTFGGNGFYYCQPSSAVTHEAWAVLHKILTKGKVALIAKGALRQGAEKIWRVEIFRDYLALRELVFPEHIRATPEQVDVKIPKATQDLVNQFIDQLLVGWNKFDATDETQKKIDEWIAAGDTVEADTTTKRVAELGQVIDMNAALQEAIKKKK